MKTTRRVIQFGFLALVLVGVFVFRANCERWCPFGGVEALYTYAAEGKMICSLGTSNFFILGGVLAMTLLLRRAFCGYICPIGMISEWLHGSGRLLHLPNLTVGGRTDRTMSLLKYVVLAVILFVTWRAGELLFRGYDPCYALISRHGTDITFWAYVVSGAIVIASLFVVVPFCRWFCPLAAVLNPLSRFGLARIKRDEATCNDCGLCAKSCPMAIPVDQQRQVTAARCTSCLNCIAACPQRETAALVWGPPSWMGRKWSPAVLVILLFACTAGAVSASFLFPLPSFVETHGARPEEVATVRLEIEEVTCRGRAELLFGFLQRDDLDMYLGRDDLDRRIPYFKLEAWPGPGTADVHVTYDPSRTDEDVIRWAITEPYFDVLIDDWRFSPFRIEGYDPLSP